MFIPIGLSITVFVIGTFLTLGFLWVKSQTDKLRKEYIEEKELLTQDESNKIRKELADEEQRIRTQSVDVLNELDSTRKRLQDTIETTEQLRQEKLELEKKVDKANAERDEIKRELEDILPKGSVKKIGDDFVSKSEDTTEEKGNDKLIIEPKILDLSGSKYEVADSGFLNNPEGTLSVWVKATNGHLTPEKKGVNKYILAVDGNNGNTVMHNSNRIYQNSWSISRSVGTTDKSMSWRLWITNGAGKKITIEDHRPVIKGWLRISVSWSKEKNYLRFYVNTKKIGEKSFNIWPSEVKDPLFIGTWPNRDPSHYFNSKIGVVTYYKVPLDYNSLKRIYSEERKVVTASDDQ